MIDRFAYPVSATPAARLARGESGYVIACRDLPEINTQGEAIPEALANAADALDEAIAYRLRENLKLPSPSQPRRGERVVAVPPRMAARAALVLALAEAGIAKVELARRLGINEKDARRLLDPRHNTKLPAIAAALGKLGKQMVISVRDAA